jgi:PAS domain S-box-containing protein
MRLWSPFWKVEKVKERRRKAMWPDLLAQLVEGKDGAYAVDGDQRIVFWNREAERLLGYTADDLLGKKCYEFLSGVTEAGTPVCQPGCRAARLAREGKSGPSFVMATRTKGGQSRWLTVFPLTVPYEEGRGHLLLHIFRDDSAAVEARLLLQHFARFVENTGSHQGPGKQSTPPSAPGVSQGIERLSPREQEVLELLLRGTGTREMAEALGVTWGTARNYIQRVLRKFGSRSRQEVMTIVLHKE